MIAHSVMRHDELVPLTVRVRRSWHVSEMPEQARFRGLDAVGFVQQPCSNPKFTLVQQSLRRV
jgi:hypothetical protein